MWHISKPLSQITLLEYSMVKALGKQGQAHQAGQESALQESSDLFPVAKGKGQNPL